MKVRREVRRVEKRRSYDGSEEKERKKKKMKSSKILLKRGRNRQELIV